MTVRISTWEAKATDREPYRATVRYGERADHHRFATDRQRADFIARMTEHHDNEKDTDR